MATTDDYTNAGSALLPAGRAWSREAGSVLSGLLSWLASTFSRVDARATYLLTDSPAGNSLVETLPEWESSLGLPDPCSGPQPTIALRQAAVRAKIAARGGQSVPYFVGLGAAMGVPITVTEFAPSRFGRRFGARFGGLDWAYHWQATSPQTIVTMPFLFGQGRFGERFATWGNQSLYCTLQRYKPAHTTVALSFPGSTGVWDQSGWDAATWA